MKRVHDSGEVARTVSAFFAVRRIMRTRLAKQSKIDPESWSQIETLKFISEHEEPKMKELAAYLYITAPSATTLVQKLVRRGLVLYASDKKDKRTARLALTDIGRLELKRTIARGIKILGGLFGGLSKSELATFAITLERLRENSPE